MRKTLVAAVTCIALAATGCSAQPVPDEEPEPRGEQATVGPSLRDDEPESVEDAYLERVEVELREMDGQTPDLTREQWIDAGYYFCDERAAGVPVTDIESIVGAGLIQNTAVAKAALTHLCEA